MTSRRASGQHGIASGGRRWWLHRLSTLVLLLVASVGVLGYVAAGHLVEQHQRDLLIQEAGEITVLFEQVGSSYEASLVGIAAIADVTGGDVQRFEADVAAAGSNGAWSLNRLTPSGVETLATIGEVTVDLSDPPPDWREALATLQPGKFAVLGLSGTGPSRMLGMAARAGNTVVYDELALFSAAAQSAEASDQDLGRTLEAIDLAIYVGTEVSDEGFLFQTADPGPDAVTKVIDVGGTKATLVIGSHESLGGTLTARWPMMVAGLAAVGAIGLTTSIELSLRRRDDALRQVGDLAAKNAALDTALAQRHAAEEATAAVEAELRQMQRLDSLGQLAGGVAHDFNNLLAVILSYSDLLEPELRTDAAAPLADLEEIREAARRGADLTRRLLQFSRLDHTDVGAVDVGGLITDLSRLLERTIGEDITLRTVLDDDGCTALLDAQSLEQAILNLVINARDAVESGGTITITTACVDIGAEEASRLPGLDVGRYIKLSVADDGQGMPEEVIRRSFDPFFTTKGRAQGTGLGLATVYGMVKSSHGHISVESEVGVGTTVTLLLPEGDEPAAAAQPPPADVHLHHTGARVLVVEDEPAVRVAVQRMLEGAGYEVVEARDGAAAVESFSGRSLDLLITDVVMPGTLTGADVVQRLRIQNGGLPAIFVTGYGEDHLEERGIVVDGATTSVLQKPFSEAELLCAVGTALDGAER